MVVVVVASFELMLAHVSDLLKLVVQPVEPTSFVVVVELQPVVVVESLAYS